MRPHVRARQVATGAAPATDSTEEQGNARPSCLPFGSAEEVDAVLGAAWEVGTFREGSS